MPGIAFAEWGPGDMGMAFGHKDAHDPPYPPEMLAARARVKAACDAAGVAFLDIVREATWSPSSTRACGSAPPRRRRRRSAAATPGARCPGEPGRHRHTFRRRDGLNS